MGVLPRPPARRLRAAGGNMSTCDRTRAVLPDWLALYYDDPIELVRGEGRHVWDTDGNALPRLLRRHPHHDDRARPARGDRGGQRAGRARSSTPPRSTSTADGGAGRADRPVSGDPRRQGVLHDVGHRGERRGAAAGDVVPALATRSSRCATATTAGRSRTVAITGNRGWSPTIAVAVPDVCYVHGGYRFRSPFRDLADAEFIAACVEDLRDVIEPRRRRRRLHDRRADPGRRRVRRHRPTGFFGAIAGGARRARHPVHRRRGADRLGPHRRALLGLRRRTAIDPRPASRSPRASATGSTMGGVIAPRRGHGLPRRQLDLDVRRQPADHRAGALANLDYLLAHDLQGNAAQAGRRSCWTGCAALRHPYRRRRARQAA